MECEQVKKEFPQIHFEPCCESCHEDDNMGFGEDLWFTIGDTDRHVCCAVERSIRKERKRLDG